MQRRSLFLALTILPLLAFCQTADMQLLITDETIDKLRILRAEPKFMDLPGAPAARERNRFEPLLNSLIERIAEGVRRFPSREWVLEQMDSFVAEFYLEDTELRERCVLYIERIFSILGIPDDGGAFINYMIFLDDK